MWKFYDIFQNYDGFFHPNPKIARKGNTQDVDYNAMQFSKPVFEKVTAVEEQGTRNFEKFYIAKSTNEHTCIMS